MEEKKPTTPKETPIETPPEPPKAPVVTIVENDKPKPPPEKQG